MAVVAAGFGGWFPFDGTPLPGRARGTSKRTCARRTLGCQAARQKGDFGGNSGRRRMIPGWGIAVSSGVAVAALAPSLSCTHLGLKIVCLIVNAVLHPGLQVSIHSASFSWASPQWLKGVVIQDGLQQGNEEQRTYLAVDDVAVKHGLLSMILAGKHGVSIGGVVADPAITASGTSLFAVAAAKSRLCRLPIVLPATIRAQLAETVRQAEEVTASTGHLSDQAPVQFTLKMQASSGCVDIQDGAVWLPAEAGDILGGSVGVCAYIGSINEGKQTGTAKPEMLETNLSRRTMQELGEDAARSALAHLQSLRSRDTNALMNERSTTSQPTTVAIESPRFRATMAGWIYENGSFELSYPVNVSVALSTAPARRALARISPILGSVVSAETHDGGTDAHQMSSLLKLRIAPEPSVNGLIMPSQAYNINIEPLKLSLERSLLLDNLLFLMEKKPTLYRSDIVPAWLAEAKVTVKMDGAVKTERVDMQIAGMHLCTWGQYSPSRGLDISLGIPTATLGTILNEKGLKLKRINPDYVFQIQIKGPLSKPTVDWRRASSALIGLGLKLRAEGLATSSNGAAAQFLQKLVPMSPQQFNDWIDELTRAPALTVDLPWVSEDSREQQHEFDAATLE